MIEAKAVWAIARRFGPYLAVALLLVIVYQCGSNRASSAAADDVATAEAATATEARARETAEARLEALREDLREANMRSIADREIYIQRELELQELVDEERARLASSYARAVEDARQENLALRERIAEMRPGEACLEMVKEVADGLTN